MMYQSNSAAVTKESDLYIPTDHGTGDEIVTYDRGYPCITYVPPNTNRGKKYVVPSEPRRMQHKTASYDVGYWQRFKRMK